MEREALVKKCKSTVEGPWKLSAEDFVNQLLSCAQKCLLNGALPSVVVAQAILESGWGEKLPLFGIKATKEDFLAGHAKPVLTHEHTAKGSVEETDYFFIDQSIEANFNRYFAYIAKVKPWAGWISVFETPKDFVTELQAHPAYSTAGSQYIETILEIIKDNWLEDLDKGVFKRLVFAFKRLFFKTSKTQSISVA